jgi:hypothetical protein
VTGLECISVTSTTFEHLESDVPGEQSHVLGIADAEINMAHIRTISHQDAKVVIRHITERWVSRHNAIKTQPDVAKMQFIWRNR